MITNELSTIGNVTERTSAAGRKLGQRMTFEGKLSASEIRASLRITGLKGKELTNKVHAMLSGEADVRWLRHDALQSAARSNGLVPDYTDVNEKGTSMVTKYIKPDQQAVVSTAVAAKDAEIAELRRQLQALTDAKAAQ